MIITIVAVLLVSTAQAAQPSTQQVSPPPSQTQTSAGPATSQSSATSEKVSRLSKVRRIYVESFGDDPISQQMQAMVISSLTESQRFTVTEEKSKADAVLKGATTQKSSQEVHAYGSGTAVGTAHGGSHASVSGSGGSIYGTASGGFAAAGSAINDSSVNTETIDSAHASVRLVDPDGDVIWTTTQESTGAKFKGASADVADKIAKQLIRDAEKADKSMGQPAPGK